LSIAPDRKISTIKSTELMEQKMARLKGRVAIISGATDGIGGATAKRFLEEGASVMLVGSSAEKLAALVSDQSSYTTGFIYPIDGGFTAV
jgi:short-subunit dehydrogenase